MPSLTRGWRALALYGAVGLVAVWWLGHRGMPGTVGSDGTTVRELAACSDDSELVGMNKVLSTSEGADGLTVLALAKHDCGPFSAVAPAAKIRGAELELSWSWYIEPNQSVAACLCTRRLEFFVPGAKGIDAKRIKLSDSEW